MRLPHVVLLTPPPNPRPGKQWILHVFMGGESVIQTRPRALPHVGHTHVRHRIYSHLSENPYHIPMQKRGRFEGRQCQWSGLREHDRRLVAQTEECIGGQSQSRNCKIYIESFCERTDNKWGNTHNRPISWTFNPLLDVSPKALNVLSVDFTVSWICRFLWVVNLSVGEINPPCRG